MSTKNKIIWAAVTLLIVCGLLYWIYCLKEDIVAIGTEKAKTEAATKVDSVTTAQSAIIDTVKKQSQNSADAAKSLIKNLPNEKATVKDTTYSAMCDYITNYRPD